MKKRPSRSAKTQGSAPPSRRRTRTRSETKELRRKLADAEAELEFYRTKQEWLQSALAAQRHARQMLEASVSANYSSTVNRIREVVNLVIPSGSTVLMVSRGDEELLNLQGQRAWHFPQNEDGAYAGYYPADSSAAISHLKSLIDKGAEYLLLPNTAFWWLEHYRGLDEWLGAFHSSVWRDERCVIYRLSRETPLALPEAHSGASAPLQDSNKQSASRDATASSPVKAVPVELTGAGQSGTTAPAIVCFPIINWDFRFQRPQQLMLRFAKAGHSVFYLSHQFRKDGEAYLLSPRDTRLWEVSLRGPRFSPHQSLLDDIHCELLAEAVQALRGDHTANAAIAVVQSPFWWPLVKKVRAGFNWPVVYDCMDYHAGFSSSNPLLVEQERELMETADLVVASSSLLELAARRHNSRVLLLRNGCDYEHFARVPPKPRALRPTVGYYGAISDWFDSDLVADLAQQRQDWDFILVGSVLSADVSRLSKLPNVTFTGEKPYAELPEWLGKFDVAILPFKRTPLTEAANPVKAYEIFAAGKPLVSVPLCEMRALAPLVKLASTPDEFQSEIAAELNQPDAGWEQKRRKFALQNTWQGRFETLSTAIQKLWASWSSPHTEATDRTETAPLTYE